MGASPVPRRLRLWAGTPPVMLVTVNSAAKKKVPLGVAFERVALQQSVGRRKRVSARTIERIWQSRKGEIL